MPEEGKDVRRRNARVAAFLLASVATARAELSPLEYRRMQDAAPEALDLRVTKVVIEKHKEGRLVSVSAKVTGVHRTASGIKAGTTIHIRYIVPPPNAPGVVGPGPVPVLKDGDTTVAYLKQDGRLYRPAAQSNSFIDRPMPDAGAATSRPSATSSRGV